VTTPVTIYVPCDSSARSVGADEVAHRIADAAATSDRQITLVRNGSRGLLWLEPLVEVVTPEGRIGYGPVSPDDVEDLLALGAARRRGPPATARPGGGPALARGPEPAHVRARGRGRPALGGGLSVTRRNARPAAALELAPADVVAEVTRSGLRGRGGARFPTGIKWNTVLEAESDLKFICCNADEGDSGTFADRMLMEGDPFTLIEGMAIAAHAVGAAEGYIYIRSEYPDAVATMRVAIDIAYARGATRLPPDRYHAAELIYIAEVEPTSIADVLIDNRDFANPRVLSPDG
jgi:formate dehydrogenase iron-sulfur subunit